MTDSIYLNDSTPIVSDATVFSTVSTRSVSAQIMNLIKELKAQKRASFQKTNDLPVRLQAIFDQAAKVEDALASLTQRSHTLARAQVDILVHSAELPEELEYTQQRRSEATHPAEQSANDIQQFVNTLSERTPDSILVLIDRICISSNANAMKLFDCSPDQLTGQWPAVFRAENLLGGSTVETEILTAYDAAIAGHASTIEIALLRHKKEVVWCELKLASFDMQDRKHVMISACNITSRKNLEDELRRHRDLLDHVINAVPDPLYVCDRDSRIVIANTQFCEMYQIERDRIIGKSAEEVISTTDDQGFYKSEIQAFETTTTFPEERTRTNSDGQTQYLSTHRATFSDPISQDLYQVSTSRDITRERQHQQRLSLLASVFNNAGEGVAILNSQGEIMEANPKLMAMFDQVDVTRRKLHDIMNLNIGNLEINWQQILEGLAWSGKVSVHLATGKQHWYWLSLNSSETPDGSSRRIVALFSDVTQLENSQHQLQKQANHDNLTGLPNRRFFRNYIDELIHAKHQTGGRFTLCFIDLDEFKSVNDHLGHIYGDQLLIAVAQRLQQIAGPGAFVARFGGDEFAAVFPERRAHEQDSWPIVEKLIREFQEPFAFEANESIIGLSLGVASFPQDGSDADTLMANADIAMYAAKAAGKNQALRFCPEIQAKADRRNFFQGELRKALQREEITLHFQPKTCLVTGQARGCEALARWFRADGSPVSPGEFIPIAEQTGLILPLGEQMLKQSMLRARQWAGTHPELLPIAINISPQQIRSPGFIDQIMSFIHDFDVRPEWFELEITENAVVSDINLAIKTLNYLSRSGFRIAIDDFGTGYSSLSYLRFFNIHTLKIDRSFVSELDLDRNCKAIVGSIISLGHGLDLTIVAEGVETLPQKEALARLGCDVLQGYLIGRPMPANEIESWTQGQQQ